MCEDSPIHRHKAGDPFATQVVATREKQSLASVSYWHLSEGRYPPVAVSSASFRWETPSNIGPSVYSPVPTRRRVPPHRGTARSAANSAFREAISTSFGLSMNWLCSAVPFICTRLPTLMP